MRTRFVVLASVTGGIALMGCSRQRTAEVAAAPTATPQFTPTASPTVHSPPVQTGPPPGVRPVGPPRPVAGPQLIVLPPTTSKLAQRNIPYFVHLRDTVQLFNVSLRRIDAASSLEAADFQKADAAVEAFHRKAANPPPIPEECRYLNGQIVAAAEALKQVVMVLRPTNPAGLAKLDEAMGYLDLAVEKMNSAMKDAETVAERFAL